MSRNSVRRGFNDPFFDDLGTDMRQMQKQMFKVIPLWLRAIWLLGALVSLTFVVAVIVLIVALIQNLT